MILDRSGSTSASGNFEKKNGFSIRCLKGDPPQPIQGSINTIDCGQAQHVGELQASLAASNISSSIPYTGGNGGTHSGQTVSSTGVTGLIATLSVGSFTNGDDNLVYTISGTPSASGTASFEINIGGQSCTLTRNVISQPTSGYGPDITDLDGNSYKTVYIGNQQWMGENLKVTKYNDGTEIPNVTDGTQWVNLTTGAWSYYDNDAANNDKYGKLYNWYAVSPITNGSKNVCPTGWHVPTDAEWTVLTDYLGGESEAGGKMKEVGTVNWITNIDASNTSLFTGLPGGYRASNGHFNLIGANGNWWSSSEFNTSNAWYRNLNGYYEDAFRSFGSDKKDGYSVRCLRD
jgi:uncharacterized protein (TIGR02145 family)